MDDVEADASLVPLHSDPRIIVATTLATLLLAGSAYIWRSNPKKLVQNSHHCLGERAYRTNPDPNRTDAPPASEPTSTKTLATTTSRRDQFGDENELKDPKVPRSKERRRRGKDPTKDIMKTVKKTKILLKPSRTGDSEDSGSTGQFNLLPNIIDSPYRTRKSSSQANSSSRSLSASSNHRSDYLSSNQGSHPGDDDNDDNDNDHDNDHEDEDEDDNATAAASSSSPTPNAFHTSSQPTSFSPVPSDSHLFDTPSILNPPIHSQSVISSHIPIPIPPFPSPPASPSFPLPHDPIIASTSNPTFSQSDKTPISAQVQPSPHGDAHSVPTSTSLPVIPMNQANSTTSWDCNGGPSVGSPYRKPPRFRSKSRSSGSLSISSTALSSGSLEPSVSEPPPHFVSHVSPPASTTPGLGELSPSFTFPSSTATAAVYLSSNSALPSGPSSMGKPYPNGYENGNTSNNTSRLATPRRSPTPQSGTSTPPPSLSAQTQLASLKGALEAARIREEKTKGDIEKLSRDLETMRWEGNAWRRREAELQAQVHHLMHQVQAYSSIFSPPVSGQPSPLSQHHLSPSGNPNASSNPASNGYPFTPSSSSPHSPPPHLHIPTAQMLLSNGSFPSPSILSPLSMIHNSPVPSFYPYMPHSPHPPHIQKQHQHHQQPKPLFSMAFPNNNNHPPNPNPNIVATPGSGPSSVAGSSSVGSGSPDLAGHSLPLPSGPPLDRGRQRTRAHVQASEPWNGESGAGSGGGGGGGGGGVQHGEGNEGWLVTAEDMFPPPCDDERSLYTDESEVIFVHDHDEDDDEEGCVSEVLADAILKRPTSIRGLSSKKGRFPKGKPEKEVQHAEFTFPSLSDLGNVNTNRFYSASAPVDVDEATDDGLGGGDHRIEFRTNDEEDGNTGDDGTTGVIEMTPPVKALDEAEPLALDVHRDMPG